MEWESGQGLGVLWALGQQRCVLRTGAHLEDEDRLHSGRESVRHPGREDLGEKRACLF